MGDGALTDLIGGGWGSNRLDWWGLYSTRLNWWDCTLTDLIGGDAALTDLIGGDGALTDVLYPQLNLLCFANQRRHTCADRSFVYPVSVICISYM